MRSILPGGRESLTLRLFGGKGGVGKTTCAAAAALAAAEAGGRVLAVSTDPAHSLGDVLAVRLGDTPQRISTRAGELWAAEIAAGAALERWLALRRPTLRTVALRGTLLDGDDVDQLLALTPPGIDELVALAEIVRRAGELGCTEVVVDTAPTGHTLRLLAMPAALAGFASLLDLLEEKHRLLADTFAGGHRSDTTDREIAAMAAEAVALQGLLRDPARCACWWITLPEPLALEETRDGLAALAVAGIAVAELVVNRMTPSSPGCLRCTARWTAERAALADAPDLLSGRPVRVLAEHAREPRGLPALRRFGQQLAAHDRGAGLLSKVLSKVPADVEPPPRLTARRPSRPTGWPNLLAPLGLRLLLFGGKGGVGKTTCAAATALALASLRPEARILLLSTDPAHSLGDVLGVPLGDDERPVPGAPPGLTARELDAAAAFDRLRERSGDLVDGALATLTGRSGLTAGLAGGPGFVPPGLDEVVALAALLDELSAPAETGGHDLVVIDTAPTGHTLRLLALPELALAWDHALLAILLKYRAVRPPGPLAGELVELSRRLKRLTALLADPARARFVPVARPAELPVRETGRLLDALRAAGIAVPAVLVNAVGGPGCPRCAAGAAAEQKALAALSALAGSADPADHCAMIVAPAVAPPPHGPGALVEWSAGWRLEHPGRLRRPAPKPDRSPGAST